MAQTPPAARKAQRGLALSDVFPLAPAADARRPRSQATRGGAAGGVGRGRSPTPAAAPTRPEPVLSADERQLVVATFVTLVEGLYAHLPLKRARYGLDPVQRLRLLAQRAADIEDASFHHELAAIITGLRDAHTRYIGPSSRAGRAAILPFMVETYGAPPSQRYIVSKVATERSSIDAAFIAGVELVWWNSVPIDRAVDLHADAETGGRPDSRRARAVESLTYRALQYGPPPDEYWVVVGYLDAGGETREERFDWRVVQPDQAATARGGDAAGRRAQAIDPAAEATRQVKKLLFAPDKWLADRRPPSRRKRKPAPPVVGQWLDTAFGDNVSAKVIDTPSGRFGYLRLWSFALSDDVAYVDEVRRLLGLLPAEGLIVDLRGNPGGLIWAAERLLQLFTPHRAQPTRFSVLATPLTRAMAEAPQNEGTLGPWQQSLAAAVATGELYSTAVPITPPERANDIGQVYGGPVVAVADANTYSAGDLFAAGFVDNEVGVLVTVGDATGAGGANVWDPDIVDDALLGTDYALAPLPAGTGFSISVRRATRAGAAEGTAIEDVGVQGRPYAMTRNDLVGDNSDLLAFCGALLSNRPRTGLEADVAGDGSITAVSSRLDRLDVYVDDRPRGSIEVADGAHRVEAIVGWATVELVGYQGDELRQRRRLSR